MVDSAAEVTTWGRRCYASWTASIGASVLIVSAPLWLFINWITLEYFDGSLQQTLRALITNNLWIFSKAHIPLPSVGAMVLYAFWILFQAFLYERLPGAINVGQTTPAGHILRYKTNGLYAWIITHVLFVSGFCLGIFDPSILPRHWAAFLVITNVSGVFLAFCALVKAYVAPSHPGDRKFSGSIVFDYFSGIELNPRSGELWDYKLFFNGRPGIIAWTLIDLSWMAYQTHTFGRVSNSMVLVNFFHMLYVVDFFYHESWYLRTIDITHEHFGFCLAWGDLAFLPNLYTLQAQYLGRYPVQLTLMQVLSITAIALSGYLIFRSSNNQKDNVRARDGEAIVWGKPAEYIRCTFSTKDGRIHQSLLLTSGWWGLSRHINYLADLMMSWAMCAACGTSHLLPWTYFFWMSALLCHRVLRDERRCATKYGKSWALYLEKVPYRLIPGMW